jgi:hypothetical protein
MKLYFALRLEVFAMRVRYGLHRQGSDANRSAPGVGLEPTTYGLTVRRSAN